MRALLTGIVKSRRDWLIKTTESPPAFYARETEHSRAFRMEAPARFRERISVMLRHQGEMKSAHAIFPQAENETTLLGDCTYESDGNKETKGDETPELVVTAR